MGIIVFCFVVGLIVGLFAGVAFSPSFWDHKTQVERMRHQERMEAVSQRYRWLDKE